ncbi:MAG TPA: AMIN domain-containing protein [Candidatus Sulfotelmatobacter sp.]
MHSFRTAGGLLLSAVVCVFPSPARCAQNASVRSVHVLGDQTPLEIEIEGSDRLQPQAQLLTGPDRLVVDFPATTPGAQLRNLKLNRDEVKSVRVGLFSTNPPVTRVVFDLQGPQPFQIFPEGRTVIVKLGSGESVQTAELKSTSRGPHLVNANLPTQSVKITPPPEPPPLMVTFSNGMLTVNSNKANLSEVLFAIHQRTGADIAIPAGAEQEPVVAAIGPASAPEVLSQLLNGSKFNFLILSAANDPNTLDRVILSTRPEGPAPPYRPSVQQPMRDEPPPAEATNPEPPQPAPGVPPPGQQEPEKPE